MELKEDNKKVLLKKRAELLAKVFDTEKIEGEMIPILPFKLENEQFAFETKYVREVYPLKQVTFLPGAPKFLYGVTNIRRKIFPIIDLKVFFGFKENPKAKKSLLIIGNNTSEFAILVDGFASIRTVLSKDIQASLPTLTGVREEFLMGIMSDGTVILDGNKVLTSPQLEINEEF